MTWKKVPLMKMRATVMKCEAGAMGTSLGLKRKMWALTKMEAIASSEMACFQMTISQAA